ncbi:MAG: class I SAM-dependent methyltransferase [Saprospiraceae bacterium]|nr:class I SAM-dependent methyltransferase [Saprospiraceae bacterium]
MKGKVRSLLEYWWKSDTIYRLHPPFLYQIANNVFEKNEHYYDFDTIEERYSQLLQRQESIESNDFSKSRKQAENRIGKFASKAIHHPSELFKLYNLVRIIKPSSILELGSCMGISTLTLGLAANHSSVVGIEGNPQFSQIATEITSITKNVKIVHSLFENYLQSLTNEKFDFIFLDGDHTYEATISIVTQLKTHLQENSVILLDDIHWSEGMYKAWNEITQWKEFSCSLETLRWGILFCNQNLTRGKFTLIPGQYKIWQKYI